MLEGINLDNPLKELTQVSGEREVWASQIASTTRHRISGWINRWMDRRIYEDSKKLCTSALKGTLANLNN